jgi:hypothetical protein
VLTDVPIGSWIAAVILDTAGPYDPACQFGADGAVAIGIAGANWDAFEECVTDFSWAPASGYGVLLSGVERFRKKSPSEFKTAMTIFSDAAALWAAQGAACYVLLDESSEGSDRTGRKPTRQAAAQTDSDIEI